jgi:hypothetical protein
LVVHSAEKKGFLLVDLKVDMSVDRSAGKTAHGWAVLKVALMVYWMELKLVVSKEDRLAV